MGATDYYPGGTQIYQQWNDANQTFTQYALNGTVITTRPYNAAEIAAANAQAAATTALANQATITANALAHVPANISYLAVAVPSVAQTTAQLNSITKAVNALIYLVNEQFTTTQGT